MITLFSFPNEIQIKISKQCKNLWTRNKQVCHGVLNFANGLFSTFFESWLLLTNSFFATSEGVALATTIGQLGFQFFFTKKLWYIITISCLLKSKIIYSEKFEFLWKKQLLVLQTSRKRCIFVLNRVLNFKSIF